MDYYLVRDDGHDQYTVTRWAGGKEPEVVYKIAFKGRHRGWVCSCPVGYKKECKHSALVNKWVQLGRHDGQTLDVA